MTLTPEDDFADDAKSKTQIKREMLELRELGMQLVKLTLNQLRKIPLDDELRQAIEFAKTINSNGAKRRHMHHIGKLMRSRDPQPLQKALAIINNQDQETNARFHRLEKLRDEFIHKGDEGITDMLTLFPTADRQILRQLIRKAQKELQTGQSHAAARSLFRYPRDLSEAKPS